MLGMASGLPLSQGIDEYLSWLALDRHSSPGTVVQYRRHLERFAAFAGGDAAVGEVADVDRDVLRAYQRHLAGLKVGPAANQRPIAISTRTGRLVALRCFLRFAAREEWLPGDLGATIDLPKVPERLPKPLEPAGRDLLLDALPDETLTEKRDRAFILFLLSTGVRISEALRLDRDDWKPQRMTLIGKGDRERPVTVTLKAREAVDKYLAARKDPAAALFIGFQPATKGGRYNRLTVQGAHHICHQVARRLGLPAFHPHQLRHTLGTLLQETVGDARLTAETLGHRGLGSVAGYTKITDRRRGEAYQEMEKAGL